MFSQMTEHRRTLRLLSKGAVSDGSSQATNFPVSVPEVHFFEPIAALSNLLFCSPSAHLPATVELRWRELIPSDACQLKGANSYVD